MLLACMYENVCVCVFEYGRVHTRMHSRVCVSVHMPMQSPVCVCLQACGNQKIIEGVDHLQPSCFYHAAYSMYPKEPQAKQPTGFQSVLLSPPPSHGLFPGVPGMDLR